MVGIYFEEFGFLRVRFAVNFHSPYGKRECDTRACLVTYPHSKFLPFSSPCLRGNACVTFGNSFEIRGSGSRTDYTSLILWK